MIAISSPRLHGASPEYKRTQQLAKATWDHAFSKIIYVGGAESDLFGYKTMFISAGDFPRIKALAELASQQPGYTAILNADLVIDAKINSVEMYMQKKGVICASSRRWNFDMDTPKLTDMIAKASLGDERGRDIFVARTSAWRQVAQEIPDYYRIGNPYWDAWMTDFFREKWNDQFLDFTGSRVVFHPRHEGRNYPYAQEIAQLCKR